MRIVAGQYGGRRLRAPRGAATRPTSDRVREAVFGILGDVTGRAVLDVFAGSGAMGLEALSRGARSATFIERSPEAVACLTGNAAMVDDATRVRILRADWAAAVRAEARAGRRYGLCLLDPPYSLLPRIAGRLGAALGPLLEEDAIVVIEHAVDAGPVELTELPVAARTDRTYGGTAISVVRLGSGHE